MNPADVEPVVAGATSARGVRTGVPVATAPPSAPPAAAAPGEWARSDGPVDPSGRRAPGVGQLASRGPGAVSVAGEVSAAGSVPVGWTPEQLALARGVRGAALALATRRAYASDWARWHRWAQARGVVPLPARPGDLSQYLLEAAATVRPTEPTDHNDRDDPAGASTEPAPPVRPAVSVATMRRWLAAITAVHRHHDLPTPAADPGLIEVLGGLARTRGTRPRRVDPLLLDDVRRLITVMEHRRWPAAVAATRDTALLLVGWAGALRRSELAALVLADVRFVAVDGVHLQLRRSKTDQEGTGRVLALPYGQDPATCPPCALRRWLDLLAHARHTTRLSRIGPLTSPAAAADLRSAQRQALLRQLLKSPAPGVRHVCRDQTTPQQGLVAGLERRQPGTTLDPKFTPELEPVFRAITKAGHVRALGTPSAAPTSGAMLGGLSGQAIAAVVKRRAAAAGLDPTLVAGHSLRAGFVTAAFRAGADTAAIRRQSGHQGDAVLQVYQRESAPLVANAVTQVGL
ncbi:MAG: hypothetical protein ACRC35_14575 [Angustibacter sp.]